MIQQVSFVHQSPFHLIVQMASDHKDQSTYADQSGTSTRLEEAAARWKLWESNGQDKWDFAQAAVEERIAAVAAANNTGTATDDVKVSTLDQSTGTSDDDKITKWNSATETSGDVGLDPLKLAEMSRQLQKSLIETQQKVDLSSSSADTETNDDEDFEAAWNAATKAPSHTAKCCSLNCQETEDLRFEGSDGSAYCKRCWLDVPELVNVDGE